MNRAERVPVWVEIPIVFTADAAKPEQSAEDKARSELVRQVSSYEVWQKGESVQFRDAFREGGGAVSFTPEQRRMANPEEVLAALAKSYPPLLRDAGIGGRVELDLHVAAGGVVEKAQVKTTSGYQALDQAALKLADIMRFAEAAEGGWVAVPILFTAS